MKSFRLEGLRDHIWYKYFCFENINDLDVYTRRLRLDNHYLQYTHYRIVKIVKTEQIISIYEL